MKDQDNFEGKENGEQRGEMLRDQENADTLSAGMIYVSCGSRSRDAVIMGLWRNFIVPFL